MDLFLATQPLRARPWIGFLLAIAGPVIGLLVHFAVGLILTGFPFIIFFPVVLVVAYLGGWLPGVGATVLSGALASWYFIDPGRPFVMTPSELAGLAFFAAVCGTIIVLIQTMLQGRHKLTASAEALREANETLERRVAERTRALVDEVKPGRPDLKVLYTTGHTRNAIVHNGVVDPGVDLLMKPFAIDQLARKVRSVLDSEKAS